MKNWQRGQVLLNSIASGLTAPTQSTTGIVAATASPALSYEIGQHFKGLAKENQRTGKTQQEELSTGQKTAHILAHAVLGAAVAAAGDNNALAGALSAGGSEAAAPYISKWLYGKDKGSDLTAEEKETVSTITSLLGTATGAAVGNSATDAAQGSLNAKSAVGNNWLIKEEVDKLLIAEEGCKNGAGIEQACLERDRLKVLDAQRDFQVLVACRNLKSQQCIDMKNQLAIIMGYIPAGYGQSRLYGLNQVQRDAYNKEYASIDTLIKLASGYTPEQIARDTKLHHAAVRLFTDLSIAGTVRDFKEADTLTDIAIAAIFAAPGLKQIEALRYAGDFRKAYQAAKEAGDLEAAKQILELAKQAPKSPNRLESLSSTEKLIRSKSDFQRIDFSGYVFSGEVKRGGKTVVGGHSLVSGQVREIPNSSTKPNAAGVYEAKIEVWDAKVGRWVPKTNNGGILTMFPKSWDGARIKNEVEHAFANKTISIELRGGKPTRIWKGITPSGVKVEGYLEPNITVYPKM